MGWYIAGGILALILVPLLIPVRVLAKYEDELHISGKWLFWTVTFYPPPEKEKKPEKEKPARPEQKPQKKKRKLAAEEVIDGAIDYLSRCKGGLRLIFRSLRIRRLRIDWTVAGEDAADCAVHYGRVCAYLGTALATARNFIRIQRTEFRVRPDFLATEEIFHAEAEARLTPLMALLGGGGIGLGLLMKWLSDRKKKRERLRRIRKAKKQRPAEKKQQTSIKERQT
ncbi:MAG TPA: DUF2953 domain-containing protein [Oscillospiraceae bacterium]|nr:DUF2953 domain-containing protein [Oscillospiraceae bacterium]